VTAPADLTVEEAVMMVQVAKAPDFDAWLRVIVRLPSLPLRLRLDVAGMAARGASGADALAAVVELERAGLAWEPWQRDPHAAPPLTRAGYDPPRLPVLRTR